MLKWKQFGIGYHKGNMFIYALIFMLIYASAWIILVYYCDEILQNEDRARYCYYDIYMSDLLQVDDLMSIEKELKDTFSDNASVLSYVCVDEMGMLHLMIDEGEEYALGISTEPISAGTAIVATDYAEIARGTYPGIEFLVESEVMVYGSAPYFPFVVLCKDDIPKGWKGTDLVTLRMNKPLSWYGRFQLKQVFANYDDSVKMDFLNREKWIQESLRYLILYIALSACVFVYITVAVFLLVRYFLVQLRCDMAIYSICGATSKVLCDSMIRTMGLIQIFAFVGATVISMSLIYGAHLLDVEEWYWMPFWCMLSIVLLCMFYVWIYGKKQMRTTCIAAWRKVATHW